MCVIIFKPADVPLPPDENLRLGWQRNSNGGGFAVARGKTLSIHKGYMKLDDFMAEYNRVKNEITDKAVLFHFRITTHGETSPENTHPFTVGEWKRKKPDTIGVMAHNGGFWQLSRDKIKSDTRIFTDTFGKELNLPVVRAAKPKLEDAIRGNKVAFLYANGEYVILNEDIGTWRDGLWFSNSSAISYAPSSTSGLNRSFNSA